MTLKQTFVRKEMRTARCFRLKNGRVLLCNWENTSTHSSRDARAKCYSDENEITSRLQKYWYWQSVAKIGILEGVFLHKRCVFINHIYWLITSLLLVRSKHQTCSCSTCNKIVHRIRTDITVQISITSFCPLPAHNSP